MQVNVIGTPFFLEEDWFCSMLWLIYYNHSGIWLDFCLDLVKEISFIWWLAAISLFVKFFFFGYLHNYMIRWIMSQ